jgi:hypothetical protein
MTRVINLTGDRFGRLTVLNYVGKDKYNNAMWKCECDCGIKVCDEWLHDFMEFYNWSMSHGYNTNLTIDRVDVNGNYEPSNCRWISNKQQQRNKHNNRNITINGETHCLSEWCEILGLNINTVNTRFRRNWNIERALELK